MVTVAPEPSASTTNDVDANSNESKESPLLLGKRKQPDKDEACSSTAALQSPPPPQLDNLLAPLTSHEGPPKPPKNVSVYMRFKTRFLAEIKTNGMKLEKPDAAAAKEAFAEVKKMSQAPKTDTHTNAAAAKTSPSEDKENKADESTSSSKPLNIAKLYELKVAAEEEEREEKDASAAKFREAASSFSTLVTTVLDGAVSATRTDQPSPDRSTAVELFDLLHGVIEAVEQSLLPWASRWPSTLPKSYTTSLNGAKKHLVQLRANRDDVLLVKKIKSSSDDDLFAHAAVHREALAGKQQFDRIMEKHRQQQEAKKAEEAAAVANAKSIPPQIGKTIQSMMTYNQGLKDSYQSIIVDVPDTLPAVFEAAFDVPKGQKTKTVDPDVLGVTTKELRYGAILKCSDVKLELKGTHLTATTKYTMWKQSQFGFGLF